MENAIKWPSLVLEVNQVLDDLAPLIEEHGTAEQRTRADRLREQAEELIQQKRVEPLRRNMERIMDLHREILFEQPGFWLGYFNYLAEQRSKMNDQANAERLFNQGHECIASNNVQGLRNVVVQLLGLIPQEIAEEIQKGYQSGLLK